MSLQILTEPLIETHPSAESEASLFDDEGLMRAVRQSLHTDEQRTYFDFVTDVPMDFAMKYAGTRWTHQRIADYLGLSVDRIACLNKALRRAFVKELRRHLSSAK